MKPKRSSYKETKSTQHKKLTWAEERFGIVCYRCGLRKGTFMASRGAEGGKDSVCRCDD